MNINPLAGILDSLPKSGFFGKGLLEGFIRPRKPRPASYSRMKENQIKKRRAKNKAGRKSRRINQIRTHNLHAKLA